MAEDLAGLREAYEAAKRYLERDTSSALAVVTSPHLLEHAGETLDAAIPYIAALEAQNAAQQRRIEALEAGLRFFAGAYARWQKELADEDASNDFLTWAINNGGFLDNVDGAFERAYDLLRAEKGGEG